MATLTTPNLALRHPDGNAVPALDVLLGQLADDVDALGSAWTAYTPELINVSGDAVGRYRRIGYTVMGYAQVTLTTALTTTPYVGLPFTPRSNYTTLTPLGVFHYIDTSASAVVTGSATRSGNHARAHVGTGGGGLNSTTPFTWAVGDRLVLEFTYEVAP